MDPTLATVIAIASAVVAAVSAAAAVRQAAVAAGARKDAKASSVSADQSRERAAALAENANTYLAQTAEALVKANQLVEDARNPPKHAAWELLELGGTRYAFENVGGAAALGVTIHEMQENKGWLQYDVGTAQRDVPPGRAFEFTVIVVDQTPNIVAQLRWRETDQSPLFEFDRTIYT